MLSENETFPLQAREGTEIDEQPELKSGDFEIIDQLGPVFVSQTFGRLEFDDDLVEAQEIGRVGVFEEPAAIRERIIALSIERDLGHFQFDFQRVLINRFGESVALVFVHRDARADDPIHFFAIQQIVGHGFAELRVLRG